MFDNILNMAVGMAIALGLGHYCDVPIEEAFAVGLLAVIAYSLSDISRHLRKATQ